MSEAEKFAQKIKSFGFRVFLSKRGTYGFFTDNRGSRVTSFTLDGSRRTLSGNYGPPSASAGTGWRLEEGPDDIQTKTDARNALYAGPPSYCQGWLYLSSLEQYLAQYQSSSEFSEVE